MKDLKRKSRSDTLLSTQSQLSLGWILLFGFLHFWQRQIIFLFMNSFFLKVFIPFFIEISFFVVNIKLTTTNIKFKYCSLIYKQSLPLWWNYSATTAKEQSEDCIENFNLRQPRVIRWRIKIFMTSKACCALFGTPMSL